MIRREVRLSPEAGADLVSLYEWIAEQASPDIALGYIERLENYARSFEVGAERGTLRSEIREGLRTVGFDRRVTIAFTVTDEDVIILGFFLWRPKLARHPDRTLNGIREFRDYVKTAEACESHKNPA